MTKYTKKRLEELLAEIADYEAQLKPYYELTESNPKFEDFCQVHTTLAIAKAKFTALKGELDE